MLKIHVFTQNLELLILSFLYRASVQHMEWKPTDVTILFVYCWFSTCFGPTGPSSGEFVQLFIRPLVQYLYRSGRVLCIQSMLCIQSTRPERYRYWTNGRVNSCTNSPEDGPVGPKHVETRQYTNKIVTSVGFHSICWKDERYKKLKKKELYYDARTTKSQDFVVKFQIKMRAAHQVAQIYIHDKFFI